MLSIFILKQERWRKLRYNGVTPDKYYISDYGRIYSLFTKKILTPTITKAGYQQFVLSSNTKRTGLITVLGHRLVAATYVHNPDPTNLTFVNHINPIEPDKTNIYDNYYSNLEWSNNQLNQIHARDNGLLNARKGTQHGLNVYSEDFIRELCEYILENKTTGEILTILQVNDKQTRIKLTSLLSHLRKKDRWVHITKDYF